MSDRPTPEKDAAANDSIVTVYLTSQRLERERYELRVEVARLKSALKEAGFEIYGIPIKEREV